MECRRGVPASAGNSEVLARGGAWSTRCARKTAPLTEQRKDTLAERGNSAASFTGETVVETRRGQSGELGLSRIQQRFVVRSLINLKRTLTYTEITETQTGLFAEEQRSGGKHYETRNSYRRRCARYSCSFLVRSKPTGDSRAGEGGTGPAPGCWI